MTWPPPSGPPGYPSVPPPQPGSTPPPPPPPPPQAPRKSNTPLILGLVGGLLALCLIGVCGAVAVGVVINKRKDDSRAAVAGSFPSPEADRTAPPAPQPTAPALPTTAPAPPTPPASIGQCIGVDTSGNFLGIGNCNGSQGTYRVLSVDYQQNTCADPNSPYITEDGYRLCLELHLVRFFCYKFPKGDGWVVHAPKCKAKGTVHIIDIVPGASNGNRCTRNYQWNRWYRFTHPTVVYCVMQY